MDTLQNKSCQACTKDTLPLTPTEAANFLTELPGWEVVDTEGIRRLSKTYIFSNFKKALAFTTAVGNRAEQKNHHPAILTEWGKVTVTWWTHSIGGLHINDCIMAAQTEACCATSL